MSQLNKQVALVTGAEVGIGQATALALAKAGILPPPSAAAWN